MAQSTISAGCFRKSTTGCESSSSATSVSPPSDAFLDALGLERGPDYSAPPVVVSTRPSFGDFEAPLRPRSRMSIQTSLRARSTNVRSVVRLENAKHETWDGAVIAKWGGYAFDPYLLESGLEGVRRWEIDPFRFLQRALDLPAIPAPDVTTESGNRILTIHVDGDGFSSRVEGGGHAYAGRVILDEILRRYDLPHTVSVIEGEVGEHGVDPAHARALEAIARDIFALPMSRSRVIPTATRSSGLKQRAECTRPTRCLRISRYADSLRPAPRDRRLDRLHQRAARAER